MACFFFASSRAVRLSAYASWAYTSREPALRDLYDPEYVGDVPLLGAGRPLVRPEHVQDLELGGRWRQGDDLLALDVFRMDFRDELVDAGQFNTDLGYPILGNAARSIHQGVELQARVTRPLGTVRATLEGDATITDAHFVHFTSHYGPSSADDVVSDGKAIGFFPGRIAHLTGRATWHGLSAAATFEYVGRIYLDNTASTFESIGPHRTLGVQLTAERRVGDTRLELSVRGMNVTDARYATGGYVDLDAAGTYVPCVNPAATRHWLAGVRAEW